MNQITEARLTVAHSREMEEGMDAEEEIESVREREKDRERSESSTLIGGTGSEFADA